MRKFVLTVALAAMFVLAVSSLAFAAHDGFQGGPLNLYKNGDPTQYSVTSKCQICHSASDKVANLSRQQTRTTGPHGGYTSTTRRCATCHVIHSNVKDNNRTAPVSKLLPGQTITSVCNFCHDLTGSEFSAYATYYLADVNDPDNGVKSAHRVEGATPGSAMLFYQNDTASPNYNAPTHNSNYFDGLAAAAAAIPGGDVADGGSLLYAGIFQEGDWSSNSTKQFTCDSCHTPHAVPNQTVNPYFGESQRKIQVYTNAGDGGIYGYTFAGSRLLKKYLTVGGQAYSEYGSAWCAGCHTGRLTMAGDNYNHPVNKTAIGYNIGKIALKTEKAAASSDEVVNFEAYGSDEADINAGTTLANNKAVGIADKAVIFGTTLAPVTVVVGVTDADLATERKFNWYPNFNSWFTMTSGDALDDNNPRPDGYIKIDEFRSGVADQNGPACQQCHASTRNVEDSFAANVTNGMHLTFPHLGTSQYLLVEQNTDDLCTNCHGLDNLP